MSSFPQKLNTFFKQFRNSFLIVCCTCVFMFDFTNCLAIWLLVLVNSDAHMGPGVINHEILFDCHQHNPFSFDRLFLKLADKVDIGKISDEFENWPVRIINFRITFPWLLKKPLFDYIISITRSVFIGSSWNLQTRWTWVKSQMSSKPGKPGSLILELRPLDCKKKKKKKRKKKKEQLCLTLSSV